jgi:hypothetical protein
MTEQQYMENQMVEMLNKTYDKLLTASTQSSTAKEALEQAGTRQEYINQEMKKWREATLDADREVLSAEEVVMIQNSDAAAQNVEFGDAPIPEGATEIMKEIQETFDYFEVSEFNGEICMSKGHRGVFKFKMPTDMFKTMIKHFIDVGIDSLNGSDKKIYLRIPIEK